MSGIIAEQAACERSEKHKSCFPNTNICVTVNCKQILPPCVYSDCESEDCEVKAGSLMRSVTNAFEKMRTPVPPLPSFDEETADEDR